MPRPKSSVPKGVIRVLLMNRSSYDRAHTAQFPSAVFLARRGRDFDDAGGGAVRAEGRCLDGRVGLGIEVAARAQKSFELALRGGSPLHRSQVSLSDDALQMI